MRRKVSSTYDELSARAATLVCARVLEKPDLTVGLSVGATPSGTYRQLVRLSAEGVAPLGEAHFLGRVDGSILCMHVRTYVCGMDEWMG